MELKRLNSTSAVTSDMQKLFMYTDKAYQLVNLFPQGAARVIDNNPPVLVAPYHKDTIRLVKNFGVDVTWMEPINNVYTYPKILDGTTEYEYYQHQKLTSGFLTINPRAFITSTMRTGKTASILAAIDYLQKYEGLKSALIVTTLTTVRTVWLNEIQSLFRGHKNVVVLHHTDPNKRIQLADKPADIYLVNYEGPELIEEQLTKLVDTGVIDCIVIDELTHYSHTTSNRWKVLNKLVNGQRYIDIPQYAVQNGAKVEIKPKRKYLPKGRRVTYCWGATGTPGLPMNIYGQVRLVNPANMNMSRTEWRSIVQVQDMFIAHKWYNRPDYLDQIYKVMQPCIRFDKDHVMPGIPKAPPPYKLYVPMSSEQTKLYKDLKKSLVAKAQDSGEVTASSASALITKLLQAAGGAVIGDTDIIKLDITSRIDKLVEVIHSTPNKTIIFAPYTAVIERVAEELEKRGESVAIVNGDVKGKKRDKVFHDFQKTPEPRTIICHEITTAYGVELSAADKTVFYGPPRSGVIVYQQALERMSSLKQKAKYLYVYHMFSTPEERAVFDAVGNNQEESTIINNLFTNIVNDV